MQETLKTMKEAEDEKAQTYHGLLHNLSNFSRMYKMQACLKDKALNASDNSNMRDTFSVEISFYNIRRNYQKQKKIYVFEIKSFLFFFSLCETTCAMAYSQRRFRPSNKYWSAALRRSCAMSKLTSIDPVYMYL